VQKRKDKQKRPTSYKKKDTEVSSESRSAYPELLDNKEEGSGIQMMKVGKSNSRTDSKAV